MNTNIREIPLNESFLCFTSLTDPDLATRVFQTRFKTSPDIVQVEKGMLWVGPVPAHSQDEH